MYPRSNAGSMCVASSSRAARSAGKNRSTVYGCEGPASHRTHPGWAEIPPFQPLSLSSRGPGGKCALSDFWLLIPTGRQVPTSCQPQKDKGKEIVRSPQRRPWTLHQWQLNQSSVLRCPRGFIIKPCFFSEDSG